MWKLDYKEIWAQKNWYFLTVVFEKTLKSPLDSKEIQPVHPKGNQSWIFIGRTDAEAETPILWPPDAKNWLTGKEPDAGKHWRREEKGTTEDEMAGWHHWLNGHEFGWTLGVGDGQGGLTCCSPWGRKEWNTTERLNWTEYAGNFQVFSMQILTTSGDKHSVSRCAVFSAPLPEPRCQHSVGENNVRRAADTACRSKERISAWNEHMVNEIHFLYSLSILSSSSISYSHSRTCRFMYFIRHAH